MLRLSLRTLVTILLAAGTLVAAQTRNSDSTKARPDHADAAPAPSPAEDISGMYSFLHEGEFLQINLEQQGVSGYISRKGDLDSDREAFLDQFFSKASVQGHDVSFATRALHGVTFEFKGRFERGPARSKTEDGYYVIRGTLKQLVADINKNITSRSREVVFKLLAQPPDEADRAKDKD